jgi:putative glycosyltransferase (TIGR04372 family)
MMKKIVRALLMVPVFIGMLILRLVRPIIKFELCVVAFHRFGHLALEPEVFLSIRDFENRTRKKIWFPITFQIWSVGPERAQANKFLGAYWRKELNVLPSLFVSTCLRVGSKFPVLKLSENKLSIHGPKNALEVASTHLRISQSEEHAGRKLCEDLGIDVLKPIVCLVNRHAAHYASLGETEGDGYSNINFDISIFEPTVMMLLARGYQVVRMGAGSEEPLCIDAEGFTDYAVSDTRSDFLDVYLVSKASFAVSTQTGPDALCLAFRKPVCYIDTARFSHMFLGTQLATWNPVHIQKHGESLSLKQIVSSEVVWIDDLADFDRLDIGIVRSTPQTVERFVAGYASYYENDLKLTASELELSKLANRILSEGLGDRGRQRFGEVRAVFNPVFLAENANWYLS